jgi:phage shock protein A
MNIFRRTADVFTANLNDLIDRFEDPERMLRQAVREIEELLPATTSAVARSIATEKLLEKTHAEHVAQADSWQRRAGDALDHDDEPLARRAIERKLDHERAAAVIERQLADAHEANETLRGQLEVLRDKHAAARTRLMLLSAQQSAAQAQRQILTTSRAPNGPVRAWTRFDRFYQQVEFAQAEATALLELETHGELAIDAQLERRSVDEELVRLKASRRPGGG